MTYIINKWGPYIQIGGINVYCKGDFNTKNYRLLLFSAILTQKTKNFDFIISLRFHRRFLNKLEEKI